MENSKQILGKKSQGFAEIILPWTRFSERAIFDQGLPQPLPFHSFTDLISVPTAFPQVEAVSSSDRVVTCPST